MQAPIINRKEATERGAKTHGMHFMSLLNTKLICKYLFTFYKMVLGQTDTQFQMLSRQYIYIYGGPRHKRAEIAFCVTFYLNIFIHNSSMQALIIKRKEVMERRAKMHSTHCLKIPFFYMLFKKI